MTIRPSFRNLMIYHWLIILNTTLVLLYSTHGSTATSMMLRLSLQHLSTIPMERQCLRIGSKVSKHTIIQMTTVQRSMSFGLSDAGDFSQYVVWVDKPVDDVGYLWNMYGDDPATCGCIVIDKQWIDENKNPIELTLNTALYGTGTQVLNLHNRYTAIDSSRNRIVRNSYCSRSSRQCVHRVSPLCECCTDQQLRRYDQPRLDNVSLADRPMDDGTAFLDFELSMASDVYQYEVYAVSWCSRA